MAKILKCPRCQEKIDVTDLSGGSTVRCEACGTMVRVAGSTQPIPKAPPPAPAARERGTTRVRKPGDKNSTKVRAAGGGAAPGRQTDLFRKMSNARQPGEGGRPRGGGGKEVGGKNTGMIIAIAAAAIVVIGGVAFAVLSGGKDGNKSGTSASSGGEKESPKKGKKKDEAKSAPRPAPPAPPTDTGVFKPGAMALVDKTTTPMMPSINPDANAQYQLLAGAGKASEIAGADYRWVTYVIHGMLSDNEAVAKTSMDAMHQIIVKRKLDASQSSLEKQSALFGFNMPEARSSEYTYWAQWYFTASARNAVASWKESAGTDAAGPGNAGILGGNPATENWEETLGKLKSGGFANQTTPEYYEFQKVKGMGKSAYPYLVKYIDHENIELGKTAVLILNELTGRGGNIRVNDGNKAQLKAEWDEWIKKN
ncbi:MAG TPA: hypothetical protein VM222_01610 [Planctomycetota bacterium]|nr:hypothetical protein [Planctomycetota bacterium]